MSQRERKFAAKLSGPGQAVLIREEVSQAVRETSYYNKPKLTDPIDYETAIVRNKTWLDNDANREMLFFPNDDISKSTLARRNRTTKSSVPPNAAEEAQSLLVKECIKCYTQSWNCIHYKYSGYSGSYVQLPRVGNTPVQDLPEHVFEVDAESESKTESTTKFRNLHITKQGWLYKGPDSTTESSSSLINFSSKAYKKRYAYLKQQQDTTYCLEFHKDDKKLEERGQIFLEMASDVIKLSNKKGKPGLEIHMQDKSSYTLGCDTDPEVDSWVTALKKVITSNEMGVGSPLGRTKSRTSIQEADRSSICREESNAHPELLKYPKETDRMLGQQRKEGRQKIFNIYPDLAKSPATPDDNLIQPDTDVYKEKFGKRFFIRFEDFKVRLQIDPTGRNNDKEFINPEPFFLIFALYDAKKGQKVSEDFCIDPNKDEIRNMLNDCQQDPQSPTKRNSSLLPPPDTHGVEEKWYHFRKKGVFSVSTPHQDILLVVRIDKVLQGSIAAATEPYCKNPDPKVAQKLHKNMRQYCSRLGHYRMPFAWGARHVFTKYSNELDSYSGFVFFRQDSSKISEEEFLKQLQEIGKNRQSRPDKQNRLQGIYVDLTLQLHSYNTPLENVLSPSLVPVRPAPDPPNHSCTLEVQEFVPELGRCAEPYCNYVNHIYVNPKTLKFDSQKTFPKARNISCFVELRDTDTEAGAPLKRIYAKPHGPVASIFTTCVNTSVLHHDTTPEFMDEFKISLPTQLTKKHHLLFTFYHISCELPKAITSSKASAKKVHPIQSFVGYAWLPIQNAIGRVNTGELPLAVAQNLPHGYLAYESFGMGRGTLGPDIKWVDGGKILFKVNVRLVSTVYTKDQHLHNFFVHCEKMSHSPSPAADVDTSNKLKHAGNGSRPPTTGDDSPVNKEMLKFVKSLLAVDVSTLINFLPVLFNQLFRLLPQTHSEEVAINAVRAMIHVVSEVHGVGKSEILQTYVKYVFVTESFNKKTVHEELALHLKTMLFPANADQLVIGKFMTHSWFFFDILLKSMAQHLIDSGRIKMARNERFPPTYQYHIQTLVQTLAGHIRSKCANAQMIEQTKNANQSLANFIKGCFSLMDRGFAFKMIKMYMEHFSPGETKVIQQHKFDFLRLVCNHEHFIPLNLPFQRKQVKTYKDLKHDYTLSEEFLRDHYLVGLLLQEVKQTLNEVKDIRKGAITVLRNLLAKHSFDDRYSKEGQQGRIATLYLPLISIILINKNRLEPREDIRSKNIPNGDVSRSDSHRGSVTFQNGYSTIDASLGNITPRQVRDPKVFDMISGGQGTELSAASKTADKGSNQSLSSNTSGQSGSIASGTLETRSMITHQRSQSVVRYDKLDQKEVKDLLVCFLFIIKNLAKDVLLGWFNNSSEADILDFFDILGLCLENFKYLGKKRIQSLHIIGGSDRARTLPQRGIRPGVLITRTGSTVGEQVSSDKDSRSDKSGEESPEDPAVPSPSDADALFRTMLEANLSSEVALILLDVVSLYTISFKEQLQYRDGDNAIMRKIFDLHLKFLQNSQSESVKKHAFAVLRAFITKFPKVLFKGDATKCGKLCCEILRCCNSRLNTTRQEACALMYWLMRNNFEFNKKRSFTRVHLQAIISVSTLINDVVGLSNDRFSDSLSVINNLASSDKQLQSTNFAVDVKELTKCIRTVLMATAQMKEHLNDPEMLVDLQYSLAKSYTSTPELRKTWLLNMAKNHMKYENFSEAAHCYIHIAALVAEYLKRRGCFPQGCQAFMCLSPNIKPDESGMQDDSGMQDVQYTEDHLTELLEDCARMLENAERYELLGDLYRLIIPIYEQNRDFEKLSNAYETLQRAYAKVVEVMRSGRRLLGKYFRVAFFGQNHFEEEDGKEYIYKEPKITGLPEICERLKTLYQEKFGPGVVKLIQDSKRVQRDTLDPRHAYIQITHVTPHFDEKELDERKTEFERNNNIRRFMYETPFTKGNKARGEVHEQYKRKTVLTTSHAFPYLKKRIQVVYFNETELSPIEVAIDEMKIRVADLRSLVEQPHPDAKRLQLKLQGSVSVQVNAGPLAYAEAFLVEENSRKCPRAKVEELSQIYKDFVDVCKVALDVNARLITTEQFEYQNVLKENFRHLALRLSEILREQLIEDDDNLSTASGHRDSTTVFNVISATGTTSNV